MTKRTEYFATEQFTDAEVQAACEWASSFGQDPAEVTTKFEIISDRDGWHARFHRPRRNADGSRLIVDNETVCEDVIVDLGKEKPELPFLDRTRADFAELLKKIDLG